MLSFGYVDQGRGRSMLSVENEAFRQKRRIDMLSNHIQHTQQITGQSIKICTSMYIQTPRQSTRTQQYARPSTAWGEIGGNDGHRKLEHVPKGP